MEQAHQLVGEGIPTYLALLEADEVHVVVAALYLLSAFREASERVVPGVEALFARRTDPFVQTSALLCLGALLAPDSASWQRLGTVATSEAPPAHPLMRFGAALSAATYQPEAVTPEILERLIDAMVTPQRLDELFQVLPWGNESIQVMACTAFGQLGVPEGLRGLITALERGTAVWRVVDTMRVAEAVLDVAFFGDRVHGRYWSYTVTDRERLTVQSVARQMFEGDDSPYAERSYYDYGRFYDGNSAMRIECIGYDEYAANDLKERFAREGSKALTEAQRQAVEAIVRCEPIWEVSNDLLGIYGLPAARDALERFLTE